MIKNYSKTAWRNMMRNKTSSIINVSGFVVKPEFAKKKRGEQYFFVNKRFVKDAYLNHAVMAAFEEMIPSGCFPSSASRDRWFS